ncbi:putative MFS multidrug transporter [Aspergillus granulosus]|uniref:MFS multidrug transporter n=1 Tax=Aspergillus granulosus TaxID=176169 RepID=A0ABR4I5U8_9EURO
MADGTLNGTSKIEAPESRSIPFFRLVFDQGIVTQEVIDHKYAGSGTEDDPYSVVWIPNDPRNPQEFSQPLKWFITMAAAIATLAVALVSSAYTGGVAEIEAEFGIGSEVATLGVSLFVLGFAIGPLLWAPLSEMFGRQIIYFFTYMALTAFNCGCAGAQNSWTLIILRFWAGAFGSSPLTNAGGVIADMFAAKQRGVAMSMFAAAPFLGPVLGPIIGGFLGMNAGWRWVMGFLGAFSGALWIGGTLFIPETYAPVLLRRRAERLSKLTGQVYRSKMDIDQGRTSLGEAFKTAMSRPWILLFREPIVFLLSLYMAIVYGTLYMLFAAYPIVFQMTRGWNQGIGALPFLGIMVGMIFAVAYSIWDNKRYVRCQDAHDGFAPPEARLPPCMLASVAIPIGLFWFAWTNYPSIHWMACIAAGVPFGFGMVLVFLSIMSYLIDTYTIFAASVLAANSVLRSIFGAVFPLFTSYMYADLGIHWASSIPAFLALACVPFPFLFYKYGKPIRLRCKYAAQSEAFMRRMQQAMQLPAPEPEAEERELKGEGEDPEKFDRTEAPAPDLEDEDVSSEADSNVDELPSMKQIQSKASARSVASYRSHMSLYEGNPYDPESEPIPKDKPPSPSPAEPNNTPSPPPPPPSEVPTPLPARPGPRSLRQVIQAGPVGRLGRSYSRFQERRPYTTQVCSSIVIYLCGDLSAQYLFPEQPSRAQQRSADGGSYDPWRTMRHLTVGIGSSIPSYNWFMFLHNNFNFTSKFLSILTKVAVQQAVFTPVFNTYFFSVHSLLSGASLEETFERLKVALPQSIVNSAKFWPMVTAFSFMYVPPQFRNVFSGCIAVGWQTYLSWLNQKAAHEVENALTEPASSRILLTYFLKCAFMVFCVYGTVVYGGGYI